MNVNNMIFEKFNSPSNHSNLLNVRILNRVRVIAIIGQLLLIIIAVWYLDIHLPVGWMLVLLGVEIILQLYSSRRVKLASQISGRELFIHILIDSLVLSGLIFFSGGANNPFIYLLLLSIALGTFMLTPLYLLLVTGLQVTLYSLLNIYQWPLELGESSPLASFHLHLTGMWVNFFLTVTLIAVFGLLARNAMLKQEKQIQSMREKQLKDEQILSLGIMSASAAHELGTPLATMAIVVDDLNHQQDLSSRIHQDMRLLTTQIDNCRNIIKALNDRSRFTRKQLARQKNQSIQGADKNLKKLLQTIIENWLVYRPQIELTQDWCENFDKINNSLPLSVEQAVTNLLDNSADASLANNSTKVEISCNLHHQHIVIEIRDFGCGLTTKMQETLGVCIQETEKLNGLGWGLFLSNASIEMIGGKVHLIEARSGGTLTRVDLPLERLE